MATVNQRLSGVREGAANFLGRYGVLGPAMFAGPRSMFTQGQQGAWYDPSDLSTLFQDAAGTIPVTGTGQPVGLMLDKRLGLVRGPELVVNGDFSGSLTGWTPVSSAALSVSNAELEVLSTAVAYGVGRQVVSVVAGKTYEVSITARRGPQNAFAWLVIGGALGSPINVPITTQTPTKYSAKVVATGTGLNIDLQCQNIIGTQSYFSGVTVKELPGNHAAQPTAASRPIFRDVGGLRYLECDGVDDGMVTGSIDFTGTNKMFVCAGVRKLSDAVTYKTVISLGAGSANAGCFELDAPGPVNTFRFSAKGSTGAETASTSTATFISPASAVLSAITDISGAAEVVLRVNAVPCTPSAGDAMSGTFSSNPIGIGCRAGGTANFNGIFYGAIIAGAAYSASQIASAERYLAGKSGVTL